MIEANICFSRALGLENRKAEFLSWLVSSMGVLEQQPELWLSWRNPSQISLLLFQVLFVTFLPTTSAAGALMSRAVRPGSHWTTPVIIGNDAEVLSPLLVAGGGPGPAFAFGFFKRPKDGYLLAIFLVNTDGYSSIIPSTPPEVVWTANRNHPVPGYAALDLTPDGDMRLSDGRGGLVWSTNTSGQGAASLNLTVEGNLKLLNARGRVLWQSYDHPTNTALQGQILTGTRLVANTSATNSSEGIYYLSITNSSCQAYILGDNGSPDQIYYRLDAFPDWIPFDTLNRTKGRLLAEAPKLNYTDVSRKNATAGPTPIDNSIYAKQFVRLEADGRLREYVWRDDLSMWQPARSLLDGDITECGYPKECGRYGLCSEGCSCLDNNYFEPVKEWEPKQGCRLVTDLQLSCTSPEAADSRQKMVFYEGLSYFGYVRKADMERVSLDLCREVCAKNCSCRAAFHKYGANSSIGDCYLLSTVLSIMNHGRGYNSSAYIKVQLPKVLRNRQHWVVALSVSLIGLLILALASIILYRRKKNLSKRSKTEGEDFELFQFAHLPGMPTKFTYQELKDATNGFSKKLGEGGFGAVFQGKLKDGTQVAVKILGYRGQGMKEFLAEVQTIGSIHHFNLVKLVGYCAERLHRLLVYEYLSNGSLENWIFRDEAKSTDRPLLDLNTRLKIILQVAKGLSYLHEECRNRIIHLDIKPQNILLDDNFNAKVSDFGLSKLVERDQSQVVTTMRGTPGYLAPEWLNSVITDKVDVYSFGVVVLETVSGKKILDYSRSQGSINLLHLLTKAAADERLADIIGYNNDDEVAMKLVKIAMWCLQMDYTNRPSMSAVVKALEGTMEVEPVMDFWVPRSGPIIASDAGSTSMSSPLLSSIIAEPR